MSPPPTPGFLRHLWLLWGLRLQIGLKEVATGDSMPKTPPGFTEASAGETPVAHLRAVA